MNPPLLRREPFGGILFVSEDAVHIELDHEAYAFLARQQPPTNAREAELLAQILKESGRQGLGSLRQPAELQDVEAFPFPVYNAPTLADFQITNRCPMGCPHCYASSGPDGVRVALEDAERAIGQLQANGVTQVAIGGGEPLEHPEVISILRMCHHHGLVPNLTTNGLYFDADRLAAMKRYCGAVALSLEGVGDKFRRTRKTGFAFFQERLGMLLRGGLRTVLQVTLSQENFAELDAIVDFCLQNTGLYGVIFLAYKEVGRGASHHHVLAKLPADRVHQRLRAAFLRLSGRMRVGYDCCLTPGIVGAEAGLHFTQLDQLEGCSAMRSSMGILPNLDVVPCTFTPWLTVGNLKSQPLSEIWRGAGARAFRMRIQQHLQNQPGCSDCTARLACLGGCPVFSLVGCQPSTQGAWPSESWVAVSEPD